MEARMEETKRELTDDFKAKVQRILYPDSNNCSSDDDSQDNIELLDQCRPISGHSELDDGVELLHRHEEFITKQLNTVRKLRRKGILAVSSKQKVENLVDNEVDNDVLEEEHPPDKEPRLPQTGKNKRRKMKKKRRREQELTKTSTKKLKAND